MGLFKDFFTSPREREGKEHGKRLMDEWGGFTGEIAGMQDENVDVNSLTDVMNKYGMRRRTMEDVSRAYNPARGNLATRLAMMKSGAARRMGGNNAMPGLTFGNIDSYGAGAFGQLEGDIAEKGMGVEREDELNVANMLRQILAGKDAFGLNKRGLQMQGMRGKGDATSNYLESLSGASTFDDLLALGGTGAKLFLASKG